MVIYMSSYEQIIMKILLNNKIKFQREKTFSDLKNGKYRYDFYLPELNIIIEVDGQYHFHPIRGRAELMAQKERDR
jgi:very-short-patch-repair endonuclease